MNFKIKKMMVTVLAMISFCLTGCEPSETTEESSNLVVEDADGNQYPTVKIGMQTWTAKNMNVKTNNSWCYGNKPKNCEKYGRLYTWDAAQKVCPAGWHLPNDAELGLLKLSAKFKADQILDQNMSKAESQKKNEKYYTKLLLDSSWNKGLNTFGFSALPAGAYSSEGKKFFELGRTTTFWSSTASDSTRAEGLIIDDVPMYYRTFKSIGYSVRCLKDYNLDDVEKVPGPTVKDADGNKYPSLKIGFQTWMTKNMNVKTENSWCFENKPENCKKYGRLYTWEDAQKVCPAGWHLPNEDEFELLYASALALVGKPAVEHLRDRSWYGGLNTFGFSVLPSGKYDREINEFYGLRSYANFWYSREKSACVMEMRDNKNKAVSRCHDGKKTLMALSVRCVQD